MSATITSDRSNIRQHGAMGTYIFSAQSRGSLLGSLITLIVLKRYDPRSEDGRNTNHFDGVWRIVCVRFKVARQNSNAAGQTGSTDEIQMFKHKQREEDAVASVGTTTDLPAHELKTTRKSVDVQRVHEVLSSSDIKKRARARERRRRCWMR
ncbi:hypothetical protein D9619_010150 [Psilocybe cf. subviscida]|uniref:Uncharacterized protein n=1 Tax=Psilocybe cf. subviscida TaxID=2480587 RepID=A0A8H5ES26_9AGAR|nr:hypothetical protein D9619_010150 [Psilocybe cf. subviscida]